MKFTKTNLFLLAILIGIVITVAYNWVTNRPKIIHTVDNAGIYLTDQIRAPDFRLIKRMHIAMIVDMRPDGETRDQISSQTVELISRQQGMMFSYIPVPHGAIPAAAVERLSSVLRDGKRPILLYCRTGKRAIRTYCLAEASRKEGHNEQELVSIARDSGF
ncbi:MAG: hypothetical protein JWN14_2401, partial [Chthonomonadales bacterium]|nr:hypothetical protein [Chthonomonadales bacterium]